MSKKRTSRQPTSVTTSRSKPAAVALQSFRSARTPTRKELEAREVRRAKQRGYQNAGE